MNNTIWIIYSTFADKAEALSIAHNLVEKRLVACVNLHKNTTSVYRWEGKVCETQEVILIAKTSSEKRDSAMGEINRTHSYNVPCIIAYPVGEVLPKFMQWVADETT